MKSRITGLLCGLLLITGFSVQAQSGRTPVDQQMMKYGYLLRMVNELYVDTVNVGQLTEQAIRSMLEVLDPHSVYMTREEVREANEPLEGGFFGIGIQFSLLRDTLMVVDVIAGGPSEKVGLLPGDRIVAIDGERVVGINLTNTGVQKRLKGEKGTLVRVQVLRGNDLIDFNITRGMIPIHSVDAKYMIDDRTGYIKIARFAATTVEEFEEAVRQLKGEGMKDLIIDLQANGGGFLGAAAAISDHMLPFGRLIVYTDGRNGRMDEIYSQRGGLLQNERVVVLLDGFSASASEIVAGAVQDWDRGLIVGRRSFGKGLVQRQFPLPDESMVRLTVAHYFTPSGRNIQKPYKDEDYQAELIGRYSSGEMFTSDSIHMTDTTRYYTRVNKRVVYGGGGIIPDIFVPMDTTVNFLYFNHLLARGIVQEYQLNYIDKHRAELKAAYPDFNRFATHFEVTDAMIGEIVRKGEEQGIKAEPAMRTPLIPEIKRYIKSLLARDLFGMNELYRISNEDNEILNAALRALRDGTYEATLNPGK